ncbi:MAG: hypothetical protein DI535_26440 [Citrobacter freundii]|nr:MAG: hypothetical protein DI535_26440 [Citrobacter freundii]
MRYVLYFLLAWFLYNLIFKFVIPVFKASRQMKRQFRQMQDAMQQQMNQQQGNNPFQQQSSQQPKPKAKPEGDYIDFEEIK